MREIQIDPEIGTVDLVETQGLDMHAHQSDPMGDNAPEACVNRPTISERQK
jgi:hypothetical protein